MPYIVKQDRLKQRHHTSAKVSEKTVRIFCASYDPVTRPGSKMLSQARYMRNMSTSQFIASRRALEPKRERQIIAVARVPQTRGEEGAAG